MRRSLWLGLGAAAGAFAAVAFLGAWGAFAPTAPGAARRPAGTLAPAPAPLSLLLLGTSLTAGGNWPQTLAQALAACRGGPVHIERLARPGATSLWGREALAARLTGPRPLPALVLIEFTVNDARLHAGLPLAQSRALAREMVALVQEKGALPVLVTMSPVHGAAMLRRPFVAAYRRAWADVAEASGAGFLDTVHAFPRQNRNALLNDIPDGVHPTDAAMQARLVPALIDALAPMACGQGAALPKLGQHS